jgi:hypothetical protein
MPHITPTPTQDAAQRVVLWGHPRSLSTVFERVFLNRPDTHVHHEPLSHAFFFSEERGHVRFADHPPDPAVNYQQVWNTLLDQNDRQIVFIKDLAFHLKDRQDPDLLARFQNTFIIRHPQKALMSLYKKLPDFDWVEAGYQELHSLFNLVTEKLGQRAIVVDADDLRRHPAAIIEKYCQLIDVPHLENSLTWQAGIVPQWRAWAGWHDKAEQSTHIEANEASIPTETIPPRIQAMIDQAMPLYESLRARRIRPE